MNTEYLLQKKKVRVGRPYASTALPKTRPRNGIRFTPEGCDGHAGGWGDTARNSPGSPNVQRDTLRGNFRCAHVSALQECVEMANTFLDTKLGARQYKHTHTSHHRHSRTIATLAQCSACQSDKFLAKARSQRE